MRGGCLLCLVVVVSTFGFLLCVADFNANINETDTEIATTNGSHIQSHSRKKRYVAFPVGSSFSVNIYIFFFS